jgi:hypothetical protein
MAAQEFFTTATLIQSGGAVVLVTTVSIAVRRLTKRDSPWIPFLTSAVVAYLGAGISGALDITNYGSFPDKEFFMAIGAWLLPFFNGLLLFLAALGGTDAANSLRAPAPPAETRPNARLSYAERPTPPLFAPWLRSGF